MKYEIVFSENAKEDLIAIVRYITDELLEANIAKKLSQKILKDIKSLEKFPKRFRLCDYKEWEEKGLRVLNSGNYLVFYIPNEEEKVVRIYRIIYGKRDLKTQLQDKIIFDD